MLLWINRSVIPDPEEADENGRVALGGSLHYDVLKRAYAAGIFPWSSKPFLNWWSPDPRAIFDLDSYRPHRSVRQSIRHGGWRFTIDRDFAGVIAACAGRKPGRETTWITADFIAAYTELHRRGNAHSVEVWDGDELIGGLYGVTIGAFFAGESMFHHRTDASKAALWHLVQVMRAGGFRLLDAQAPNPHLLRLGAVLIPRSEYLRRLREAVATPARLG